jgi:hypothetical protein
MAQILLSVEDDVLKLLLDRALAHAASLEDVINEILLRATAIPVPAQLDFSKALAAAIEKAAERPSAEDFLLEDLFSKEEWALVPTPKVFGREFRKRVEQQGIAAHTGRTISNRAVYRRS